MRLSLKRLGLIVVGMRNMFERTAYNYMEKTYTYTVYHISGKKIGCTTTFAKRMKDQGFTNWEILWQQDGDYEFGWIAGDKEIELQKQYGYKVDLVHYQQSRLNRFKLNNNIRSLGGQTTYQKHGGFTKEECSMGGKVTGKKHAESDHLSTIGKIIGSKIRNCPYCNRELKGAGAYNSHTKKCRTING